MQRYFAIFYFLFTTLPNLIFSPISKGKKNLLLLLLFAEPNRSCQSSIASFPATISDFIHEDGYHRLKSPP
ncbi:hypothetical protein LINPERPRIM_LOCUS20357 [Linum perenne]